MTVIFPNIEAFSAVSSIPKSLKLAALTPHIIQIQDDKIKKIIGATLLTKVLTDTTAETPILGDITLVLQRLTAALTLHTYLPQLNVMITAGGLQQNSETESTMAATMWRTNKFEASLLKDVGVYYNQLLEFLDEHETEAIYANYLTSAERLAWKNTFIYSPSVAQKYVSTQLNYYTLRTMGPTINRVSRRFLKPLLGSDLYLELLARNQNRTPWDPYTPLQELIEEFVINMALYEAVPELRIGFDEEGTGIVFGREEQTKKGGDHDPAIYVAQKKWEENAEYALSSLKNELNTNYANYPLYTLPASTSESDTTPFNSKNNVGSFL